ncbi:MAG: DnaT-like ssDNA-binding protein [Pseudomonadota bacterium]
MALIVEDGTGVAGADSYLSVADADAHHADRGNAGWTGDVAAKEAALRKATDYLGQVYRLRWLGARVDDGQALDWPRTGFDAIGSDVVPGEVRRAAAELALMALGADLNPPLERGGRVTREKVGPIETEFADGAPGRTRYPAIDGLLAPLLARPGRLARV